MEDNNSTNCKALEVLTVRDSVVQQSDRRYWNSLLSKYETFATKFGSKCSFDDSVCRAVFLYRKVIVTNISRTLRVLNSAHRSTDCEHE
jgi:hypothetical protein